MKKFIFFATFMLFMGAGFAQNNITLRFTGQAVGGNYLQLNSVTVKNLTRNWTETLTYPDTTLTMNVSTGISENIYSNFGLNLQYNDWQNGKSRVELSLPQSGDVILEIYDINGRKLTALEQNLQQGLHSFNISMNKPQIYLLRAITPCGVAALKMLNVANGEQTKIKYNSFVSSNMETKLITANHFEIGDQMQYTGYATIGGQSYTSSVVTQIQNASEDFELLFNIVYSTLPTVTTNSATNVASSTVTLNGNVTADGGAIVTSRGFLYGPSSSNLTNDVTSGSGTGSFTKDLTGLTTETTYYYKAYATNSAGTSYGNVLNFTTTVEAIAPTVTTNVVSEITTTTATCGGNVTDDGNAMVTARGVCWSTSQNPTIVDNHTTDGNGTGSFTSSITGVNEETTYYVRAYATNSIGTSYGTQRSFTTSSSAYAPTIVTNAATSVTATSVTLNGNVTADGGATVTSRGFLYGTSSSNLTNDVTSGSGTGSFTKDLTDLTAGTTYYYKAYATNSAGTSYGNVLNFTTSSNSFANQTITVNGVSFTMIAVEGGTFNMGASDISYATPVHQVTLDDYWIGETEVTQALWLAVMGSWPGTAPSSTYGVGNNYPAYYISWDDCQNFITALNAATGKTFRMPTEAEWEYAARGGNQSNGYTYSGSNTIGDVAWYSGNSSSKTHVIKTKSANELGIYDMSGNVYEWCSDWYESYSSGAQINPTGAETGSYRMLRGSSWRSDASGCRVALRNYDAPDARSNYLGFRLVLVQ